MIRSILMLLCCLASPVFASPIIVKSGEHGSFTRLVIYLPSGKSWSITENGEFSNFSVEGWLDGFDTTDVFQKIDTNRLRSLTSTQDNLIVAMNCDCQIETKTLNGGFIQLDLYENKNRKPLQRPILDNERIGLNATASSLANTQVTVPQIWDLEPLDTHLKILDKVVSDQSQKEVSAFGQRLVERLSRGSTLKHLNTQVASEVDRPTDVRISEFQTEEEILAVLADRAQFSDSSSLKQSSNKSGEVSECVGGDLLEVSKWGGSYDFNQELSKLRAHLIEEFDNDVVGAKSALAEFYLYYGLADEAAQILKGLDDIVETQTLLHLAKVIKDDFSTPNSVLESFIQCSGETSFWATIAGPLGQSINEQTAKKMIAVFLGFPDHLQLLVAKKLANVFSSGGNVLAANLVQNALDRKVDEETNPKSEDNLVIDLKMLSRDELMRQVSLNARNAPEAMALFLEKSVSEGQKITVADSDLASAFAFQLGTSEMSSRLEAAKILALAASNFPEKSLKEFIHSEEVLRQDVPATLSELLEIFLDKKNIVQFVELAWKMSLAEENWALSAVVKSKLAKALVDMGQPQLVKEIIASFAEEQGIYYRSQALALEGQYSSAAELLEDSKDSELRRTYLDLVSIHQPELAWARRDSLKSEDRSDLAWSIGDWSTVSVDPERSEIAASILVTEGDIEVNEKPISSARETYETSRKSRTILVELLGNLNS